MHHLSVRHAILPLLLAAVAATTSHAQLYLSGSLTGDQQVPPTDSTAAGETELALDPATGDFLLTVTLAGLDNAITGAEIGLGATGVAGPVLVGLDFGEFSGDENLTTAEFSGTLDPEDIGPVLAGDTYLAIRTDAVPDGELRGQLMLSGEAEGAVASLSTRGYLDPELGGSAILIGGIFVDPPGQRILVRVIGEGLQQFLPDDDASIEDAVLSLVALNGDVLGTNDNWREGGQENAILATGFAPDADSDAALLIDLPAGGFTVHGSSASGAGLALVEIYRIDEMRLGETFATAGNASVSEFSLFNQALIDSGLDALLNGPGPYTVFAPTDAALTAAPPPTEPAARQMFLLNHIVAADLGSDELETGSLTTAAGTMVEVDVSETGTTVGSANVVEADMRAKNGVIHTIDGTLPVVQIE